MDLVPTELLSPARWGRAREQRGVREEQKKGVRRVTEEEKGVTRGGNRQGREQKAGIVGAKREKAENRRGKGQEGDSVRGRT